MWGQQDKQQPCHGPGAKLKDVAWSEPWMKPEGGKLEKKLSWTKRKKTNDKWHITPLSALPTL